VDRLKKKFDMMRFLEENSIPYDRNSGINTLDYVATQCPFCNSNKPTLGLHITNGFSTCWKCGWHSLWDTVKILTGETNPKPIIEKYGGRVYGNHKEEAPIRRRPTKIIVPGKDDWNPRLRAWNYIEKERHFDPEKIISPYGLKYTTHEAGDYSYRIVFPIIFEGRIVSYQARTYINNDLRFMACKQDDEILDHQHLIYNWDRCLNSENVLLVEGLFDCIRLGLNNVGAVFGTSTTVEQANLLRNQFKNVFLLFDQGEEEAMMKAEKFAYQIGSSKCNVEILDLGIDGDPDEAFLGKEDDVLYLKKELRLY
jgi:hypothetical protein